MFTGAAVEVNPLTGKMLFGWYTLKRISRLESRISSEPPPSALAFEMATSTRLVSFDGGTGRPAYKYSVVL